nr:ATP-binding protein [Alphaproteobacteria bacterium]
RIAILPDNVVDEPHLRPLPEFQHGLANLQQNAMQFATAHVDLHLIWHANFLQIKILDDGPGMAAAILDRVGEPYISSRTSQDGHMGLGIFIALNLLEKTGATVKYDNLPQGGTATIVTWQDAAALGIIKS